MAQSQPSQSSSTDTQQSIMTPEERKEQLTKCLLSQYRFCAGGGVVTGAGYSLLKRQSGKPGPWPMLAGGFVGTLSDFVYGYFVECAHLREGESIFE